MTHNGLYKLLAGESGGDALRNTLATVVPGLFIFYFSSLDLAVAVSIGALLASLTDMSGSRADKWISAKWCIPAFFIVSFITVITLHDHWVLIVWLMIAAFAGGMLFCLGARIALVGILALILISFTIGLWPVDALTYSVSVMTGAIWYFVLSLILVYANPYRSLRHALRRSFGGMAALLQAKAQFYDTRLSLEKAYENLSALHVTVIEQQDTVRLLLLREQELLRGDHPDGQQWLHQLLGMIDLYEVLTAIDHDYETIRKSLDAIGLLEPVRRIIILLADEVQALSANTNNTPGTSNRRAIQDALTELSAQAKHLSAATGNIVPATIHNLQEILNKIIRIESAAALKHEDTNVDYRHFIPGAAARRRSVKDHLSWSSGIFRFALRWALLFGAGGMVGFLLPDFKYTYWVLLTIAIVARPTFAVTQSRNSQRIKGTVAGLLITLPVIYFVSPNWVLLAIAVTALYGFFLFNLSNYTVSVLFITITAIILLNMHHGSAQELMGSRAAFTLLGAVLAVLGWFLIPVKQHTQLHYLVQTVIQTNQSYLDTISRVVHTKAINSQEIRLARKKAHTTLAAFSEALNQLRREPGNKNKDWKQELHFQSIAYRVNSLIVGIYLSLTGKQHNTNTLSDINRRISYVQSLLTGLQEQDTISASA